MTITTRLYTFFHGQQVGTDKFGNRYFREKNPPAPTAKNSRREKRWVMYNGLPEPTKVTPEWHGWLHYTFDKPPTERTVSNPKWLKQPIPNLTGTKGAYVPPGHLLRGGVRDAAAADYEAWKP